MSAADVTTSAPGGAPFVRKASGLVRDFSVVDQFIYNVFAVAPIVVGTSVSFFVLTVTYPRASLWLALLIAGAFCIFEAIAYSFLVVIMPRSGGDYVFQSRVFGGGFGTICAFTNSTLAQVFYMGIAGWILAQQILSPFFLLLAATYDTQWMKSVGTWMGTDWGWFVMGLAATAFSMWINAAGLRLYSLIQRYVFWIAIACTAIAAVLFLFTTHADFVGNFNHFMSSNYQVSDAYQKVTASVASQDFSFSLGDTIKASVIAAFSLIYPVWGVQQSGEVRKADSLRANIRAMAGAEVFCLVILLILAFLMTSRVGIHFLYGAQSNFGTESNILPVPPFFGFLVAMLGTSAIFVWLAFVMFFFSFLMNWPNACLGSSRTMMAMSLDRVLPEWAGRVSRKTHTPLPAIAFYGALGLVACLFYSFKNNDATALYTGFFLINVVALAGSVLAAAVLPYRRPQLFKQSSASRYMAGKVPMMSIAAGIWLVFAAFIIFQALTATELGVNKTKGLVFLAVMYGSSLVIYLLARYYRRKDNVDLKLAYQELPVE